MRNEMCVKLDWRSACGIAILLPILSITAPASAQRPFALLHSLFDPGTNAQAGAHQGYSVAIDGDIAVVGVPHDDVGGEDSGVAKVYDATTGALLHTLSNPNLGAGANFGSSVAISGTRVVVVAPGSAYVYDLTGPVPTVPVATLSNANPAIVEGFGHSVAISGTRVLVGAIYDETVAGNAYVYDLASATPGLPVVTLANPSPVEYDFFGNSVAISGSRVVVGAPLDDTGADEVGSAYVYDLASATPTLPVATLLNPTPAFGDSFGYSVAISGTRVLVGARWDDTGAEDAGSAYVYDLAGATPALPMLTLTNPSPTYEALFGSSVAISGTRIVIGAYQGDTEFIETGVAYVYDMNTATPSVPVATLNSPTSADFDQFGGSVAISETRVVVGAYQDDTGAEDAGSAYVYDLTSATPSTSVATLNDPSPALHDLFGYSVAVSGTRVVVGAYQDDTGAEDAGSAYVYDLAGFAPTVPVAILKNPDPTMDDQFGFSVAISGERVVVGAYRDDTATENAGSAYVYDLASATPDLPVATLNNPSPTAYDFFGYSVAISGTRVVVGALYDETRAGIAHVYDLASETPAVPKVTLHNPDPADNDQFGQSVAISGSWVVVGAYRDDTNGELSGSAYVFDIASATPTMPLATLSDPTPAEYAQFGFSVAISGKRVVVGAYWDDTAAENSGNAYVYDLTSATPTLPVLTLTNPNPATADYFGTSVAISGTRVVVMASGDDTGTVNGGSAYVYDLASVAPNVPVARLTKPSPAADDYFGVPVAIDGPTIVIGYPLDDTKAEDRGGAYVFGLAPAVSIAPATPGFATLSWTPATSSGFVLQWADSLTPANWVDAPSGALNPVTISTTNAARFYRLFQPGAPGTRNLCPP